MEELTRVLKSLRDKPDVLQAAVNVLEKEAPTSEQRTKWAE